MGRKQLYEQSTGDFLLHKIQLFRRLNTGLNEENAVESGDHHRTVATRISKLNTDTKTENVYGAQWSNVYGGKLSSEGRENPEGKTLIGET